ncbi:MAG: aminotransferase class I/II-fold pyridoxal phosphate-dependent enzyme [Actinomycetota bacterium]|nr:aminotransferase class I/II-fold pyridoxal phosphate-dependent enzyme [Actinomycetota bacterium]
MTGPGEHSNAGAAAPGQVFELPPYPYDGLSHVGQLARGHAGGMVDLSIGTPCDPAPDKVIHALASSGSEHGYPSSAGSARFRAAACDWLGRRFGANVDPSSVAACIGSKELVAGLPGWLRLRRPDRDVVFFPAVSYPTYAMGARLAGCRAVPVPAGPDGRSRFDLLHPADVARGLVCWINSPANPTGALDGLVEAADWGRRNGVLVASDECYAEFTWQGKPRSILEQGVEGVLAVHSLSKRSNMAGMRAGFFAGDPDTVHFLAEVRKHAGFMVPGPVQAAAVVALDDDSHVRSQRERYRERLALLLRAFGEAGLAVDAPAGTFYLWVAPGAHLAEQLGGSGGWPLAEWLARSAGVLVSPGQFYGTEECFVRVAAVAPLERLQLVAGRLEAL